jgi:hypothetical protein
MQVKGNKQVPTLKLPQHEITQSQHLALMKDAQLLTELLIGNVDDDMKEKTASMTTDETKLKRIKAQGMEQNELSSMSKYEPGRKINQLQPFDLIPKLTMPLQDLEDAFRKIQMLTFTLLRRLDFAVPKLNLSLKTI